MRSSISLRSVLVLSAAAAAMFALSAGMAQAANLTWDTVPGVAGPGDSTITGGSGIWSDANANWTSDGGANNVAWNNAADPNDTAVFGGTAGTVTLGTGITVGGLQFNTTGYIISTGANTLTFGDPNNTIALNNVNAASLAATITGAVGGTGNVALSLPTPGMTGSVATLTLNGTSAGGWSGATTIGSRTTLALAANNQALVSTSGITLSGGGITLTNTSGAEAALDRVADGAGITSNGGTITFTNTSGADTYAETVGSVALTSGALNIHEATNQASTGSQTLTLAGLMRTGSTNTSTVAFSSATALNATKNMIKVTGASATPAGQIIGPWATAGTTVARPTDYAVYDANGYVLPANITANNNETTWGTGTNINLGAAATLTVTRTLNTLRYSGAAGTLALGANNLETYGLLNGGTGLLTVTGTGALTTPSGGGNLYITTGNNSITVSAPINDNGGAVTLVKSGNNTLTLSGTNGYTGGTVLNEGTLTVSSDSNLGVGGAVTVNGTATLLTSAQLTFNRDFVLNNNAMLIWDVGPNNSDSTIAGAVSGGGGFIVTETLGLKLTSTNNTFTGPIGIANSGIYGSRFETNSLADVPGAGQIRLGSATGYGGGTFTWGAGAISPLTLNYRQIDVAAPGGWYGGIVNNNANDANTITVNTDLLSSVGGTKTLILSGVNTGNNRIAGKISNGAGVVRLTKDGAGTWIVSGANTFTGGTTVAAGTLNANAAGTLSTGSVTVTAGTLVINAADAMADTASLYLPSATTKNLTMNADDTVGSLFLGGLQQPNNTYTSSGFGSAWMNGTGILTIGSAATQPLYWDLNDTGAGAGSATPTGTWDATSASWNAAADGTGSTSAWSAGRTAAFAAGTDANGTYTVTVDGTRDIGGLTFEEGNVTLSPGTAGGLRMTADSLAYVATGLTATVETPISQDTARSFTKGGTGTLILNAANAYTGTTTVNAGTLILNAANAYTGPTAVNAGTLRLTDTNAIASSSALSLGNGATLELRSDTSATFTTPLAVVSAGTTTTIDLNNNGTGSGNTLTLSGGIRFENTGSPSSVTATVNITGGNDYVLRTGVSLNPGGNPYTLTLNPTGVSVELSSATGPTTGSPTYVLGGTSTGNKVLSTAPVSSWMYFTKSGTGTWTWEPVITSSNIIGAMIISQGKLIVTGTLLAQGRTDQTNRCVRVNGGQLDYNNPGAVNTTGTTSALVFGGGNLDNSSGAPITTSTYNPVQLWNANFTFIGSQGANSDLNLGTGAVTLSATRQVTVGDVGIPASANTTLTVGGVISGTNFGLTKAGLGTLALSGANAYTGPTIVSAGTLLVNSPGSLAAASAVTVNTGGTLGGTGTINGAVTVNDGGTLSPGASAGTLTVNNSLAMGSGSTYVWQLGSGDLADLVDVNGSLTLASGGWTLKLMSDGGTPGTREYDLFTYDTFPDSFTLPTIDPTGDWTNAKVARDTDGKRIYLSFGVPGDTNGDFVVDATDYIALKTNFGMTEGATLAQGNFDADIDGNVDWDDLQILMANFATRSVGGAPAAPEPGSVMLLMFGTAALLRRRRANIGRTGR